MSLAYPTEIDYLTTARDLLAFIKGNGDRKKAEKDAWLAAGYLLGRFEGEPQTLLLTAGAPTQMSEEEALTTSINAVQAEKDGKVMAVPPFVWAIVAKLVQRILAQALGG